MDRHNAFVILCQLINFGKVKILVSICYKIVQQQSIPTTKMGYII